jgi:hypothetical protein
VTAIVVLGTPDRMIRLSGLSLAGTRVTDAGLQELLGMTGLRVLELDGTGVTGQGVEELRKVLPEALVSAIP